MNNEKPFSALHAIAWIMWRYHERRYGFYDRAQSWTLFVGIMVCLPGFVILAPMTWAAFLCIGVGGALCLWSPHLGLRAIDHCKLRNRYIEALSVVEVSDASSEAAIALIGRAMARGDGDYRHRPRRALLALCWGEYLHRVQRHDEVPKIPWWSRVLAQVWDPGAGWLERTLKSGKEATT